MKQSAPSADAASGSLHQHCSLNKPQRLLLGSATCDWEALHHHLCFPLRVGFGRVKIPAKPGISASQLILVKHATLLCTPTTQNHLYLHIRPTGKFLYCLCVHSVRAQGVERSFKSSCVLGLPWWRSG